ncbi:MAG: anaerobic ribonucleoside triphosphate reductase [Firmicutes bacterium ADurb.Bin182]|nr:MAG: anaerobic ribonucleoside triphosphate reductase [Firmicutes bacterium ADurb.Bin182]
MQVRKKNGSLQDFNIDKIMLVIEHISDECNQPLTLSDINLIRKSVLKSVENKAVDVISTAEIRDIVFSELSRSGFSDIAAAYMREDD